MKKLFFIATLFLGFSLSNNLVAQSVQPTGFLKKAVVFINKDWEVVILVTCDPPHTEYCLTRPKNGTKSNQNLVESVNNAIAKESDWEIELVESNSYSKIYKYTSKRTMIEEPNRFAKTKFE